MKLDKLLLATLVAGSLSVSQAWANDHEDSGHDEEGYEYDMGDTAEESEDMGEEHGEHKAPAAKKATAKGPAQNSKKKTK